MSFPAKYPGRCSDCKGFFVEGDPIMTLLGGWGHSPPCPPVERVACSPVEILKACEGFKFL